MPCAQGWRNKTAGYRMTVENSRNDPANRLKRSAFNLSHQIKVERALRLSGALHFAKRFIAQEEAVQHFQNPGEPRFSGWLSRYFCLISSLVSRLSSWLQPGGMMQ